MRGHAGQHDAGRATTGSLVQLLLWRAQERPDFPLLYVEDEGPWTVGAIATQAADLSLELEQVGMQPGDRILLRLGNDERFLAALGAVWLRGGTAIAMHPAAPLADALHIVRSMAPVACISDPTDPVAVAIGLPMVGAVHFDGSAVDGPVLDVPIVASDDEALILLTSGSTGVPKGVVLTHDSGWANIAATVSAFRRHTRIEPLPADLKPPNLVANPLSHTAGVVRLLFALYVGRSVVLLRKFDARAAKCAIDRHGIDNLTINPTMMRMLMDDLPEGDDLGAVRYVSSGTAPLSNVLLQAFEDRFGVPVLQAYGQTEAFGGVAIESVKDVLAGRRRPGSVGRPLPGVEVRIVGDDSGGPAPTEGEIWVRTKSVTAGYIGVEQDGSPVDGDGWLHTGDVGRLDEDGYLFITGRLKNIIISGGFNIVPEELEAALMADEHVREAAVVGLPDDRLGEVPVAVLEADDAPETILERLQDRLAPYKRPRRLVLVDRLPRVPNGKVDRRAVVSIASGVIDNE